MPRWFAACLLIFLALPARAADPLDLARGLREIGQPDLAMEYLDELEKANPPAAIRLLLPLERAQTLLSLAEQEADESVRRAGLRRARGEFESFAKQNPKHPRTSEAQLALARVTAAEAMMELSRSRRSPAGDAERAARLRAEAQKSARAQFQSAARLFTSAAASIGKQLKSDAIDSGYRRELERAALRAELERGINQFRLSETFAVAEAGERDKAIDSARIIFDALAAREPNDPAVWKARAWAAMIVFEKGTRSEAEKRFRQVKAEALRNSHGADGVRLIEFFEAQIRYLDAVTNRTRQSIALARSQVLAWLEKDRYKPRMTPERLSMTFYYAFLTQLMGNLEVVLEKQTPEEQEAGKPPRIRSVSSQGKQLYREAAREYARLLEFDNEYSDRAAENRNQCVRIIVGDEPREPMAYDEFEECQMAALVQARKYGEAKLESLQKPGDEAAEKAAAAAFEKTLGLMERAQSLIRPETPAREVAEAHLNLATLHWEAGQYDQAASIGDALARSGRGATAARGGLLALDSLLKLRERRAPGDDAMRASDRERAAALTAHLEANFPHEGATNSARRLLAALHANERNYRAAFELLARVGPNAEDLAVVRTAQARLGFLINTGQDDSVSEADRRAIFLRAVADAEAVPRPGEPDAAYFMLRNMLANLYLTNAPDGFAKADQIAGDTLKAVAASSIPDSDKATLAFAAEEARLRSRLGQAAAMFQLGKYQPMADAMAPALAEIRSRGRAMQPKLEGEARVLAASLDGVRRDFVVLAMHGQIRQGQFDRAAELFELLDSLGGSAEATSAALGRLVGLVRPQIEQLRRDGKTAEAEELAASVGRMLRKQADKPELPAMVHATLGRSMRDLGRVEDALPVLDKVPRPAAELLARKTTELDEEGRNAVVAFQIAQIERARALRALKRFDDADAILRDALGADDAPGWARSLEFRREAALLLEDKAHALDTDSPSERQRAWSEAKTAWERLAGQYTAILRNPKLEPHEREKLAPVYLELLCDLRRCIARGNAQLLANMPDRLADSNKRIARQVHEIETANPKSLTADVRKKYADFLNDYPAIREEYVALGGKAFLESN